VKQIPSGDDNKKGKGESELVLRRWILLWESRGGILRASAQLELLLLVSRVRSVFSSASVKDVQLGNGGPPGQYLGADGWRAVTRVLRSSGAAVVAAGGSVVADILNGIFPSDCAVCGAPKMDLGGFKVCEACVGRVGPQQDALCARCGDALGMESARFAGAMGVGECTMCRMAPPEFARAVAFASYDNEIREMLHLLKFDGQRGLAEHVLGEWLAAAVLKLRDEAAGELVVVPVPLFAGRERLRGFNQAGVLAAAAVKRLRKMAPEWKLRVEAGALVRVKDTRAMYALSPHQKRANIRGAFRIADAEAVRGREVLLVDDIMTTGATARECSRVLLRAGATKVWVATVARAMAESVGARSDVATWDVVEPTSENPDMGHPIPRMDEGERVVEPDVGRRVNF